MANGFDVSSVSSEDEELVDKIHRRIDQFLTALGKNSGMSFTGYIGENKLQYVRVHLEIELINERESEFTKTFISYCKQGQMISNILQSAEVSQYEPKDGVVLCSPGVGHVLVCRRRKLKAGKKNPGKEEEEDWVILKEKFSQVL